MNIRLLKRATAALAIGHIAALLFLLLSAFFAIKLANPDRIALGVGFCGIITGALAAGIAARALRVGLGGAFTVGALYAVTLLLFSLIAGGTEAEGMSLAMRIVFFSAAALICGLISVIPLNPKPVHNTKSRQSAVDRYINGKM